MILAATAWPDVAMGFLAFLASSAVPLAWGVLAHRKKKLELAERELELASEKAAHKQTRVEMRALNTQRLERLQEEDNQAGE